MLTLEIRLPAGRYHATPGGHHVNEGQIEWPPSPWRLVRAFLATGYATLGWERVPSPGIRLVEKLSCELPRYGLPPASAGHSRHYMPLAKLEKGREATTLVFDTWADVGDGRIRVNWPIELDTDERALIEALAGRMGYLGRSESWVEVEASFDRDPTEPNAWPCEGSEPARPQMEQVLLTAPVPAPALEGWLAQERDRLARESPLPSAKAARTKVIKALEKAKAAFPKDLVDALQWDTARWRGYGWGQPPGSRRVLYWRRRDALDVGAPRSRARARPQPMRCMLVALATATRNRSALPIVARTLPQAEKIHQALIARAGKGEPIDCPELVGKDDEGRPLAGHRHLRVLPLDLDGDGHLDHVLLTADMGLGAAAQEAIRSLRVTWQKGGDDLQVSLVGGGSVEDLRQLPERLRPGVERLLGPRGGAKIWESSTPYVPPRHLKRAGKNSLEGQIRSELEQLGIFGLSKVEVLPWEGATLRLRHAVTTRGKGRPQPPQVIGLPLRLELERPVLGPICVGYGSHFGLGRFEAEVGASRGGSRTV